MNNLKTIIQKDNNNPPPKNWLWEKNGKILEWNGDKWTESKEFGSSDTVIIGEDEYTVEDLNKISNIIKGFTEVEQYPILENGDEAIYDARQQHNQVFGKILDKHLLYRDESYGFSRTSLGWLNISNFLGKTVKAFGTKSYGQQQSDKIYTIEFGNSITEFPGDEWNSPYFEITCILSYDNNGTTVSNEQTITCNYDSMWIPTLFGDPYCFLGVSGPIHINGECYFIKLPLILAMTPYGNSYDTTKVLTLV